ncbi:hypothetical protein PFICI_02632 [Pestalotiopsis fici W106-1]|uniref:Uncharacterized protein n=1 Tax=Pestalotiopsis fici (strain W106-1 / CGMCC3.15140) TaxID=1229662 RepID=W3XGN9_PESFW|nr:uncharacterized protein PFICI_02632 [Pestalotiopsis fici W106-1]ETS84607.1 hypothetical protein PFICI_02632 [Pestalotiopsis fici W106-1]
MSGKQQQDTSKLSDYDIFIRAEEEREKDRLKSMPALSFQKADYKPPERQYEEMRASEVPHDQRKEDRERKRMERRQKSTNGKDNGKLYDNYKIRDQTVRWNDKGCP